MKPSQKGALLTILIYLWMLVVSGGYFVYHKPFTPQQAVIWLKLCIQIAVTLLTVAGAGGMGLWVIAQFRIPLKSKVLQSAGLGFGMIGSGFFLLSLTVGVSSIVSLFLLCGILIGFRHWIFGWLNQVRFLLQEMIPNSRFSKRIAALIGFLLLASWLVAISPPLAFDSLVYHLSLPLTYLQKGKFEFVPQNPFWGMPQLGEMLYTFAMSLGGIETAPLVGWSVGLLSLIGIGEILRDFFSRDEIWVAYAVMLCGLTSSLSLGWGYVDWLTFFWGACALEAVKNALTEHSKQNLLLAGIFSGFSVATKYTAAVLLVTIVLAKILLFFQRGLFQHRRRELSQLGRELLIFSLGFLISSLPWWLKNLFAVGQPFYPLIFPAAEMSALRIRFYSGVEPFGNWWTSVLLPFSATFLGVEGKEGFNASIGPLFLLLSPFSIGYLFSAHTTDGKRFVGFNLLVMLIGWVVWGMGSRLAGYLVQSRLYLAIFPSLVILSAFGYRTLHSLRAERGRIRFVLDSLIVFVLLLSSVEVFSIILRNRNLEWMSGMIDTPTFLSHNLGWHYAAMEGIQKRSQSGRTLLLFEPRNFYCLPNCDGDEILDEWYIASFPSNVTIDMIIRKWKEKEYQSVLIFHQGADFVRQTDLRYSENQWKLLEQLVSRLPVEQTFGDAYVLYRIP